MTNYNTKKNWILADLDINETIETRGDAEQMFCEWFHLGPVTFTKTLNKMYSEGLLDRKYISVDGAWSYVYRLKEKKDG